ncbi:hypothetical protein J2W88_000583 [Acidovorax delafieldii]|uniref:Uncharacterized protein n=1 Tax=Acidovorax delafieldii TaxID=47920 RepID=A0AAJ2BVQ2_ACIDE|nr:hypothetical protein [Acidovorax delafieldii]MDR6765325.1 hypothetical protein [Acidovorax delafieldii]MDR6835763.1 hypothetical protein [Acidovorax delafieldii]MDR7365267.1 hypothetical protein [Acidovorax delafieldii]
MNCDFLISAAIMGWVVLSCWIEIENLDLIIRENGSFKVREDYLFTIEVACVEDFVSQFHVLNLKSQGAHIASEIFEWPGGKSVSVIDIAGNKFLVSEEHLFSSQTASD